MNPWPEPEVRARVATAAEIPKGARAVSTVATSVGWTVVATYARGTYPGRKPRLVDSLALRMWRQPRRAVAVWHGVDFQFACTWSATEPITAHNVTTLRAALREVPA